MRYFFEFSYRAKNHVKEVKPESVRDLMPTSRIVLSTFFPDLFSSRTVYKFIEQVVEKDKITYQLTAEYLHGKSVDIHNAESAAGSSQEEDHKA